MLDKIFNCENFFIGFPNTTLLLLIYQSWKSSISINNSGFYDFVLQNSVHEWSRDHRVHHKYSETNADPHNAKRGFFFAHMGWLMCRKHPAVKAKGKQIDMSDLEADPIIMFQHKYALMKILLDNFF